MCSHQKQPLRSVPKKRCSENIQQIYRTLMPKCNFNKVALEMSGTVKRHYFLKAEESLLTNITFLAQSFLVSKLYMGILTRFGNFGANICLIHSTCCLTGCIFAWNHCGQIFSFRITQKIVPVWKYDENFCLKLTKIANLR